MKIPVLHFTAILFSFLFILMINPFNSTAQEINFGTFADYTITLENISMGDLIFEPPVVTGGGTYEVQLADAFVMGIIGVKYLDVGVLITGDGELYLDGNPAHSGDPQRSIPFTLKSAYANRGQNNITDARFIAMASNLGDVRFPVLARLQVAPGPPPTPPTGNFDQSLVEETAFLFLYGEIEVGNVLVGTYMGTITINVQYDQPPD